ncbi:MAG: tubulin-like doman-containing protein, partial [Candidatus Bathyarchaeia archaeon]
MRRALIIGLGGCGCRVVRMVKERVEWRYGGLDKTPFLQLMGVDTALDAGLEGEDLFVHITVSREGYRRLIDDVRQHRDRPDLEPQTWLDVTVIGDKTEVSEGAGGIRMVGRTAFLFPSNFNRTVQLIRQKLDKLRTLTISDASQAFGQTIGLSNELFIYVVATLCAGTGSSAFLDMGYLIKRQAEYLNLPVTTVAIVTLPPLNTTDTIKLRNTYGSLCELDYFSRDGIVYRAKFPDEPRWLERSDRPYNFVYIVAPDRYGKSALPDHFALEAAIAEYLFTDVFLDETKVRDARREDMVSHAFHLKMPDGAPYRFLTFGMSLLQFPVQQIQEACAYQLVKETLSEWLTEREPSVIELEALYREIGISGENPLRQRLLSPEGDPRGQNYDIVAVVRNRLEQDVRNYREPFDLDIVQRQILVGFGEGEVSAEGDIPLGRFKQVIE